jgi:hypothetical protein
MTDVDLEQLARDLSGFESFLRSHTRVAKRQRRPDEITAEEAIELLGTYRQHFFNLVKEGTIIRHYRRSEGRRGFYLRDEILATKKALDGEDDGGQ